ncbi:hypothetical protein CC117_12350 [Parafrankia colletiae]|uniref:Uncharacterized protein n=1 Tax=Parafrankia colletiae TaxID=573497 RepID=A0A1S1R8N8_9ACTN|nr:hypothetical protein CC117_12350 [Parafrankia colletiae]
MKPTTLVTAGSAARGGRRSDITVTPPESPAPADRGIVGAEVGRIERVGHPDLRSVVTSSVVTSSVVTSSVVRWSSFVR